MYKKPFSPAPKKEGNITDEAMLTEFHSDLDEVIRSMFRINYIASFRMYIYICVKHM